MARTPYPSPERVREAAKIDAAIELALAEIEGEGIKDRLLVAAVWLQHISFFAAGELGGMAGSRAWLRRCVEDDQAWDVFNESLEKRKRDNGRKKTGG